VVITLTAKGLTWREFAAKRVTRILPLYLAVALPILAFWGLLGRVGWREVLSTVALWPVTDRAVPPVLGVGWTLCFEALFYAATALVLWRRAMIYPLLAIYAAALLHPTTPLLHYLGNPMILEFLAGVLIAYAPRPRWSAWAIPAGLALLIALHPLAFRGEHVAADMLVGRDAAGRVLIAAIPCGLMIWGAMGLNLRPGLFSYLGDASYSVYLIHLPLLRLLIAVGGALSFIPADLLVIGATAMAVVVGCRIYEGFEKPVLAYLRRATPQKALPAAA
jgi:exopolysaccharide production protein ExoZ